MFKKTLALILCSTMLLTGCSQNSLPENNAPDPEMNHAQTNSTDDSPETAVDDTPDETTEDTSSGADDMSNEISETDTREPETVSLVMNKMNGNEIISVTMTGLCQYDSLASDTYTDIPDDGNVFLVMFLQISNHDNGDDYINPEALSATVDGTEVTNCALFNQPESYEPIFNHISKGEERTGFIVWQIPSDWKVFQMKYDGWTDTCALTVTADVTPEMLCPPPVLD